MIIAQIYDLVLFKRFYYLLILTYAFKKRRVHMILNYPVQIDVPEFYTEFMKQIEAAGEEASSSNGFIYIMIFFSIFFLVSSYLLFFKPELVYKINESWKSYTLNECTDQYRFFCKFGAVVALIFAIICLVFVSNGNIPEI